MTKTPALSLLFVLAGCGGDQGLNAITNGGDGAGPAIEVDPDFLDFGTVGRDDDPVVREFQIRSVGATDLTIEDMTVSGDAAASFTILSDVSSFVLAKGAEETIEVQFEPMGANDQLATVIVSSDDSDAPQLPVELMAAGAVPELEISPDPIDFSTSYIGCEQYNTTTLTNVGTDTLVIDALDFTGDEAFTLVQDYTLPITLEPADSSLLSFTFLADTDRDFTGELSVTSNEPLGVRTAEAIGAANYAGEYEDLWEIPTDPPADIMFAVDQSGSMGDDQSRLANNFSSFISQLSGYSNDWHIIVANDDNGCNSSGILTPSVSNYESRFSASVMTGGGAYTESLLTVGANAIEATDSGECNAGFMRPDAQLHLILVSDEPEQSSWTNPGSSWSSLVQQLIDKKGSSGMVKVSAIAGPVPGGCGSADPGTGYSEAVAATGGVFLSICSDWSTPSNLALLAEASINQDTFVLSHTAAEETITVKVNGNVRSTWTFDEADNAVVFTEHIPSEGDDVDITYSGIPNCD